MTNKKKTVNKAAPGAKPKAAAPVHWLVMNTSKHNQFVGGDKLKPGQIARCLKADAEKIIERGDCERVQNNPDDPGEENLL